MLGAVFICSAQVINNRIMILGGVAFFMLVSAFASAHGYVIPVLLFFLPWSTILKLEPGSISFYTVAIIVVCIISFIRTNLKFNIKCFCFAIGILFVSLVSKLLDGSGIALSYLMFMFLLFLLPNVTEELFEFTNFRTLTIFFSIGIITAALSAQQLANIPTIARYIDVYSWDVIVRHSGYYGDANFYSAHITAAFSGVILLTISNHNKKLILPYFVLSVMLLYCGFISASKAFTITTVLVAVMWFFAVFTMRDRPGFKLYSIFIGIATVVLLFTSGIFSDLINVVLYRFSQSDNASELTTGRTERWADYLNELLLNPKVLLLGKGFNNVKLNELGSHNTVLQIIYQFGIVGGFALMAWIFHFIKQMLEDRKKRTSFIFVLILLTGAFLPWFAIDMLFFDEFFLIPIYVCAGINYFAKQEEE